MSKSYGPNDWIRTSGKCSASRGISMRQIEMRLPAQQEAAGSLLRTKKKRGNLSRFLSFGPSDWIRTSGKCSASRGISMRQIEMRLPAQQEAAGSLLRTKKKRGNLSRFLSFGPSDWIRTSGLLNPIQARYQTSPHPDIVLLSDSHSIIAYPVRKCKHNFSFSKNNFSLPRRIPPWYHVEKLEGAPPCRTSSRSPT